MNRDSHPVEWALFLNELDEAREHLDELEASLQSAGAVDEVQLRVDLGHVYAHLIGHGTRAHTSGRFRKTSGRSSVDSRPT